MHDGINWARDAQINLQICSLKIEEKEKNLTFPHAVDT